MFFGIPIPFHKKVEICEIQDTKNSKMKKNSEKVVKDYDQKIRWSMVFMCIFIVSGFFAGLNVMMDGKVGMNLAIYSKSTILF